MDKKQIPADILIKKTLKNSVNLGYANTYDCPFTKDKS